MAEALSSPEVVGPVGNNPITNMQQRFATLPQKNKMGILIGVLIGSSKLAYDVAYPLLVGFSSIPKVAVVPIFVVWFGAGTVPAILTSMVISIFPVVVNVATGLATIEPELEDVLRALGASKLDVMRKVGIPRSMPYFYGSLKVAITLAFVGTTVSEMTADRKSTRLNSSHQI